MVTPRIPTEVGEIKRVCAPSCRKNLNHEACACTNDTKTLTKVEIFAVFDGVRRYRAWFAPNTKEEDGLPRISNKERFNERGQAEASNVMIPDTIYRAMARRALAVFKKAKKALRKAQESQLQNDQKQAPPK